YEGVLVEVSEIRAGTLDFVVGVGVDSRNQVRAVEPDACAGVIHAGGDVERLARKDADQRRNLPVVDNRSLPTLQRTEVAGGDQSGVEDVVHIEAARAPIEPGIGRVLVEGSGDVASGVGNVAALGPGIVCQEAEVI